jgi:hypothetical protein
MVGLQLPARSESLVTAVSPIAFEQTLGMVRRSGTTSAQWIAAWQLSAGRSSTRCWFAYRPRDQSDFVGAYPPSQIAAFSGNTSAISSWSPTPRAMVLINAVPIVAGAADGFDEAVPILTPDRADFGLTAVA